MAAMRSMLLIALVGCSFKPGAGGPDDGPVVERDASVDAADASVDASVDASIDAFVADASPCFGNGIGALCLSAYPTAPLELPAGGIDTTIDANCTEVLAPAGVPLCVLAGTSVTYTNALPFRAVGTRPLVIVAATTLTIETYLTVSSLDASTGAGASTASCMDRNGAGDVGGGGGGAGGSFGGRGGNGGTGDTDMTAGFDGDATGGVAVAAAAPTAIRAGCWGSNGGSGGSGQIGIGGWGGGAIYLIAGQSITLNASIYAVGQGGSGGAFQAGGGGGGSGGLIGLDAPTVVVMNRLNANGGSGGEAGGPGSARGQAGTAAASDNTRTAGGAGITTGGDGGAGSGIDPVSMQIIDDGVTGGGSGDGGGGGGGGAGYVYVKGALMAGASSTITPAAVVDPL